uniref:Uncharacterized protein n=1 Tax=Timema monikensis TaxID=170555 RepID=A0A7R9HS57_9NEOP|nr:unnamed protein product [Timema monikensis]
MRKHSLVDIVGAEVQSMPPPIFVWYLSALCAGADEDTSSGSTAVCRTRFNAALNSLPVKHGAQERPNWGITTGGNIIESSITLQANYSAHASMSTVGIPKSNSPDAEEAMVTRSDTTLETYRIGRYVAWPYCAYLELRIVHDKLAPPGCIARLVGRVAVHKLISFPYIHRYSNLDLPVIGSLVYCKRDALDHATTEAGFVNLKRDQPRNVTRAQSKQHLIVSISVIVTSYWNALSSRISKRHCSYNKNMEEARGEVYCSQNY